MRRQATIVEKEGEKEEEQTGGASRNQRSSAAKLSRVFFSMWFFLMVWSIDGLILYSEFETLDSLPTQ